MEKITDVVSDERPIKSARSADEVFSATVGMRGVTRMCAYEEMGNCDLVPWIAVYKKDEKGKEYIWRRLNAAHIAKIEYVEQ